MKFYSKSQFQSQRVNDDNSEHVGIDRLLKSSKIPCVTNVKWFSFAYLGIQIYINLIKPRTVVILLTVYKLLIS